MPPLPNDLRRLPPFPQITDQRAFNDALAESFKDIEGIMSRISYATCAASRLLKFSHSRNDDEIVLRKEDFGAIVWAAGCAEDLAKKLEQDYERRYRAARMAVGAS